MFDGVSCGRLALELMGLKVKKYYAYEIEEWPILCSGWHWPDIIQCGSVVGADFTQYENIDLLLGGSPCQGFSFAGKQLNFDDPRSVLFFEYVRALKELRIKNPKIKFLLENVVMKQEYQDVITEALGVKPVKINSALVSAQSRPRLYWTNISEIAQPEDRGILLADILEYPGFGGRVTGRRINTVTGKRDDYNYDMPIQQVVYSNKNPNKSNCLTTVDKDNIILSPSAIAYMDKLTPDGRTNYEKFRADLPSGKSGCVTASFSKGIPYGVVKNNFNLIVPEATKLGYAEIPRGGCFDGTAAGSKTRRGRAMLTKSNTLLPSSQFYQYIGPSDTCDVIGEAVDINGHDILKRCHSIKGKAPCLTAASGGNQEGKIVLDDYFYRKLTTVECERLQGWPDGYTEMMPKTHAMRALGNGWQIDTIIYIY